MSLGFLEKRRPATDCMCILQAYFKLVVTPQKAIHISKTVCTIVEHIEIQLDCSIQYYLNSQNLGNSLKAVNTS